MAVVGHLGQPPAGGLSPGSYALVHYNVAEDLWHSRLLLAHVDQSLWVILTPDGDLYIEDFGNQNRDITAWRIFDPAGPPPYGIDPG